MSEETQDVLVDDAPEIGQPEDQPEIPDYSAQIDEAAKTAQALKSENGRLWKEIQALKERGQHSPDPYQNMSHEMPPAFNREQTEREKINEHIQELQDQGRHLEANEFIQNLMADRNRRMSDYNRRQLRVALDSLNDPTTASLKDAIEQEATALVDSGQDPASAVMIANERTKNNALMGYVQQSNPGAFEMITKGKTPPKQAMTAKWDPKFEKAYQDGLDKGLWKDRDEFRELNSPAVREAHGIG